MIRAILLFAVILFVAVPGADAAIWPFTWGSKKTEDAKPAQVFVAPEKGKKTAKKSAMDKLFNQTPVAVKKDVVINGKKIEGLTQDMLVSSYAPKTPDEIRKVAYANRSWEGGEMAKLKAAADARVAAAHKKSVMASMRMRQSGAAKMAAVPKEGHLPASKPLDAFAPKPPVVNIFNKTKLKKPDRVFKNY